MPEVARERSNLPRQIKAILDGYPLGDAILREFLQNSDDAGATEQIFILDGREHPKERVADPILKDCQGPALLAINDTLFSLSDWEALGTIHGSNKTTDENKTGKYGLGFRACYHLTDNPQVLSGDRLRIFDPHEEFQGHLAGGLYINTVTEGEKYLDHIAAFQAAQVSPSTRYEKTAIRLPLRKARQAQRSQIRSTTFTVDDIRSLFTNFVQGELEICLLFLKHIKSVELREIDAHGTTKVLGRVEINGAEPSLRANISPGQRSFRCQTTCASLDGSPQPRNWRIVHHIIERRDAWGILAPRLGSTLTEDELQKEKLTPHVGLAIPLDSTGMDGPLFTLLPLPIRPGLPLCMHGTFALTSDRQHLKNNDDKASREHREGLLVAWNRLIFDTLAPQAWAKLLQILVNDDDYETLWRAWPPFVVGTPSYWSALLPNLLKIVIDQGLRVFPVSPSGQAKTAPSYVSFQEAIFRSSKHLAAPTELLIRTGLSIVEPPLQLVSLLERQDGYTALSPKTASKALKSHIQALSQCDNKEKDNILEYVLSETSDLTRLGNIMDLPLVPLTNGDRARITSARSRASLGKTFKIPATLTEEQLFGPFEPNMVSLYNDSETISCLPPSLHSIFINYAGDLPLSLRRLSASDLLSYLQQAARAWKSVRVQTDGVSPQNIDWLVRFWNDVDLPPDINAKEFQKLHLIPTDTNSVRKVQGRVLSLRDVNSSAAQALSKLGVHLLHKSIKPSNPRIGNYCRTDLAFLIDLVDTKKLDNLGSQDWSAVSDYLTLLANTEQQGVTLQHSQLQTLKSLKIFPTWTSRLSATQLNPIVGGVHFISELFQFPVPVIRPPCTFVLFSHNRTLSELLDPAHVQVKAEPALLELIIDHWLEQSREPQQVFVNRIIARFSDLGPSHQSKFITFPFVSVGTSVVTGGVEGERYLPPSEVIDPSSPLHTLYVDEGLTPTGAYGVGTDKLRFLQAHSLIASSLTERRVTERIDYINKRGATTETIRKSNVLLQLLDQCWHSSFATVVERARDISWLPCGSDPDPLTSPENCRDSATNSYLFDLCLNTLPFQLRNGELRAALGWNSELPTTIILSQLENSLNLAQDAPKLKRLEVLIKELSDRLSRNTLSLIELEDLRGIVGDSEWIPSHSGSLLDVQHAMLSTAFLGRSFQQVHPSLLGCIDFLRATDCDDRPTLETLLDEYQRYTPTKISSDDTEWIIRILEELSRHDLTRYTPTLKLPGRGNIWWPFEQTYYDDQHNRVVSSHDAEIYPIHPSVSSTLSRQLKIPFFSALDLDQEDEDEDEDDEGMAELLVNRIQTVLKDYDIKHAFNEFAANASDAGATDFSILLDERRDFASDSIICPAIEQFQRCPAVILFNNALFTESDFEGIRRIGRGTKKDRADAIGKYGLGALSVFHFTDLPVIISNKHIMILDPSGAHLPPKKGSKRTVLYRKLSTFSKQYPDQLEPLRGLFEFPLKGPISEFQGTLFRLPLPTSTCTLPTARSLGDWCKLLQGYQDLGRNGFFFTQMKFLGAGHVLPHGRETQVGYWWSGRTLERKVKECPELTIMELKLSLTLYSNPPTTEHWIITTSAYSRSRTPTQFHSILNDLKIRHLDDSIYVQTAFPLTPYSDKFHVFSTLRLPQVIDLPFHLQAPFAIPSSRRHIHSDSRDATGGTTLPTEYNIWLLRELVPKHYLSSLETLQPLSGDFWKHWPDGAKFSDDISRFIAERFFHQLPASSAILLESVLGEWLAPNRARYLLDSSRSVKPILQLLREGGVVRPHLRIRHAFTNNPDVITPNMVAQVLHQHREELTNMFKQGALSPLHIDDILVYLLRGGVDISGLPLLIMADGNLCSRSTPEHIYHIPHPHKRLASWISSPRILDHNHHIGSLKLLLEDPNSGVTELFSEDVCALLREKLPVSPGTDHSIELIRWIQNFWAAFPLLYQPPNWEQLADLPLIPTYQEHHYVSLRACREGVVLASHSFSAPIIHEVLSALGISMVHSTVGSSLRALLHEEKFSIASLLRRLDVTMKTHSDIATVPHFGQLAQWIREDLRSSHISDKAVRGIIRRLPIWEACLDGCVSLHPLGNILILPRAIPHDHEIIANYSQSLLSNQDQIALYSDKKCLTAAEVLTHLNLPQTIPRHHLVPYSHFLKLLRITSQTGNKSLKFLLPDGNCTMRPACELYDINVPLFAGVFRGPNETTKFVHPIVRGQLSASIISHLQVKVNTKNVVACAEELHNYLDNLAEEEARSRAVLVYKAYTSQLPSQVMRKPEQWARFSNLRFIPREASRCRHASYEVGDFNLGQLPMVVSPSRVVTQQYERIAWTQRALLPLPDPEDLHAVNPEFGVPDASDVVEHLCVLALHIAPLHPRNRDLIQDLTETYRWLKENEESARVSLLTHEEDTLFLNVDDPHSDGWSWHSARQLMLGVERDSPVERTFYVRNFLKQYDTLLRAAGVEEMYDAEYQPKIENSEPQDNLRVLCNEMRLSGTLTDVYLKPMNVDAGIDLEPLKCHKLVLASVPHLREALNNWNEAGSNHYPFYGTFIGAYTFLEFIYTGTISLPNNLILNDETARDGLLDEFLGLLELADQWEMSAFKDEIGRVIVLEYQLINLHTYQLVRESAEDYHASALFEACKSFEKKNAAAIQRLSGGDKFNNSKRKNVTNLFQFAEGSNTGNIGFNFQYTGDGQRP